jgi:hypothetical protein
MSGQFHVGAFPSEICSRWLYVAKSGLCGGTVGVMRQPVAFFGTGRHHGIFVVSADLLLAVDAGRIPLALMLDRVSLRPEPQHPIIRVPHCPQFSKKNPCQP